MKVLIIEDEQELVTSISTYLTQQGFVCDSALDFDHADLLINLYKYDCIVVDITLPDGSGLEIIKQLKEIRSSAGIIIVSAKNALDDKINGLAIGADDYLPKPFHLAELNARIKAVIRRKLFDGEIVLSGGCSGDFEITFAPSEPRDKPFRKPFEIQRPRPEERDFSYLRGRDHKLPASGIQENTQ